MSGATTVIDIVAQVTDDTARGANSATSNVTKLEQKMKSLSQQIQGMKGKSKIEVAASLKDMATKGLSAIAQKGKAIAGKVWTVTLKAVDLVTAPFKKVWSLISSPITQAAAFAGLSLGLADTMNTFKDFEQGMANVKAISGATGKDFEDLSNLAKKLGETTQFSASEAAAAMENLAMAGHKTKDILAEMPGLLDLAAAGGVDIATAADVTSSVLAQFSMDASEASRVADVLAATATNSKTDVAGLGESFKYAGTVAGQLGYSIEDVALAIGMMGNSSIDGTMAGTALKTGLMRLAKQEQMTEEESNAMAKAAKRLGIEMKDSDGKMKPLKTLLTDMRKGFKGITDETERTALATALFGQNASAGMLTLFDTSEQGEQKFNDLAKAIENAEGSAKKMAETRMDTFEGSLKYLQSAAEGVKIAIGEKLSPYARGLADWVTEQMPNIQSAVGEAVDFVLGKIDGILASIQELTNSPEWANAATVWDKIKLAWDKLIAEPFDEWWNGTGKTWLAGKAEEIGQGIGTALNYGLMALLGMDADGAISDGVSIGKSFAEGFSEGFDGEKVGEALKNAILAGMKGIVSDAGTLLPGGKEASATAPISAGILAYGGVKAGKAAYDTYKVGKGLYNGTKAVGGAIGNITGITEGINIAKTAGQAAAAGNTAAESAMVFAESGALGTGVKIGANAAKVGGAASEAAGTAIPIIGGIISAIGMGFDAHEGTKRAGEWTGKDTTGAKVASGFGAAIGGTGYGILGDESAGKKTLDILGNAGKGAGIGGAIGAGVGALAGGVGAVPGAAIGAAIGGGIETLTGMIGGANISKGFNAAGEAIGKFFTDTVPKKAKEFADGASKFFTQTVPQAASAAGAKVKTFLTNAGEKMGEFGEKIGEFFTSTIPTAASNAGQKISGFFTETIPAKFDEFKEGLISIFTEQIPFALGYAAGKLEVFFTETVPQKWEEFTTGITDFFTQTVPAALEAVGQKLTTFFTETVPEFFTNLWDGITNFFTQTIPNAIQAAGTAISTFFTQTVPQFFTNLWQGITDFFTQTVAPAIQTVGAAVTTFFTTTVPNFFTQLWDGVTNFFTTTVPQTIETVKQAATTFFTQTVPNKINEIWDGITTFITTQVPAAISAATEAVTGFFESIKSAITGFFDDLKNSISSFISSAKSSFSAGHAAATGHAEGGIMTQPHIGLVGEDGPEAIIPLGAKRKSRGISLWAEAGKRLGILPHAEGGLFGGGPAPQEAPEPVPGGNGGSGSTNNVSISVNVTMNPAFTINGSGEGGDDSVMETIERHMGEVTESVAWEIAQRLRQIFPNMPTTEVG